MRTKLYKHIIKLRQFERSRYAQESYVAEQKIPKQEATKRVNQSPDSGAMHGEKSKQKEKSVGAIMPLYIVVDTTSCVM
jgi:hypothetical protein